MARQKITWTRIVQAKVHMVSELHPARLRNKGRCTLKLHHEGDAPLNCQIMVRNDAEALLFRYEDQPFSLAAGDVVEVAIDVWAQKRPFFGSPRPYLFDVQVVVAQTAVLPTDRERSHRVQIDATPYLPLWMVSLLSLLLILFCLGGMLLFDKHALPTETATVAVETAVPTAIFVPQVQPVVRETAVLPPASCKEYKQLNPNAPDGEYELYLNQNASYPLSIYCHNMESNPTEYLSLNSIGNANFSSIAFPGEALRTEYTRVRIDLRTLVINRGDDTFATSSGSAPSSPEMDVIRDYGTAIGCQGRETAVTGHAVIDLTGTPFILDESVQFTVLGQEATGEAVINDTRTIVTLSASGRCGWIWPQGELKLIYVTP